MLVEHIGPDSDQDYPAQQFRVEPDRCQGPNALADLQADDGKQAGHYADNKSRQPDGDVQHGHAESHRQGVHTGSQG